MPRKGKQQRLPGTDEALLKDVICAAEEYEDTRNERQDLTRKEVAASQRLLAVMRAHDLTEYSFDGKRVSVVASAEKVRVRKIEAEIADLEAED